ncbi:putative amino acid permease YhdG [Actinomadura rubteroloni]|uniref:Putative amino acid permease YhdG n=1 Tax=Actinomadura rubteroloni TaxID=1926885 RepID=A0A2P4UQS7_9ACTN|nr:amino acid permease [Actinomadura rubteroloni]POM27401.1 putative amino acid permease YhdG [Actinomadura rubteroloni]
MSVPTAPSAPEPSADARVLQAFGYRQELHRSMGRYASFAAGFSFISVLTTVFQFFGLGFAFGGPAFFWTWPVVLAGQFLVALCFAELAARYPISGAIYQWSSRMSTAAFGWFAGWIMVLGQVVVIAAAALALQVVLPAIWDGFQLVGGDPSPVSGTGAANAAVLGLILLAATTFVNVLDNRIMARVNVVGVTAEIIGAVLIVVLLLTHADHAPSATFHVGAGRGGAFGALLVASFAAAYVLIGFDSAGEMSEETRRPRAVAPRTILTALGAAGLLGGLIIVAGLLAAPSLTDGRLATDGLSYVLTSRLGDWVGKVLLADVVVAICVATLAIQTAATRMLFSMARDGMVPFSRPLARISPRTGMPIGTALVTGVLAALVVMLDFASPDAFLAIGTTCIVMVYVAYAMVIGPLLYQRLRGSWRGGAPAGTDEAGRRLFSLGRWGLPVNALALAYGLAMAVNLAWPRPAVYAPASGQWYFTWFTVLFLGGAVVVGALYRRSSAARSGRVEQAPAEAGQPGQVALGDAANA